ncbi:MAG: hypothetical protein JSS76_18140 [Bacteroidetes bacterium]|nr:hypothetical protein [Bacteroidota bacterium]
MKWIFEQMLRVKAGEISVIEKEDSQSGDETTFIVTTTEGRHRFSMTEVLDFVQNELHDESLARRLRER